MRLRLQARLDVVRGGGGLHGEQLDVVQQRGARRDRREGEVAGVAVRARRAAAHQRALARRHAQQRQAQPRAVCRI
jgi:hypothetical protein